MRIITTLFALLITFCSFAQDFPTARKFYLPDGGMISRGYLSAETAFRPPVYTDTPGIGSKARFAGSIIIAPSGTDTVIWVYRAEHDKWSKLDLLGINTDISTIENDVSGIQSKSPGNHVSTDTNTANWIGAAIIRPVWNVSTHQNDWIIINDGDHVPIIIDSVVAMSDRVRVYFDYTANKINTFLIGADEAMVKSGQAAYDPPNYPYYTPSDYRAGASVLLNYADIYISQTCNVVSLIRYTGSAWTQSTNSLIGVAPFNAPSQSYDLTYAAGRLEIRTDSIMTNQHFPVLMQYAPNGDTALARYSPFMETYSDRWVRIWWWDRLTNDKLTLATPPTNLGVYYLSGTTRCWVNPITQRFPTNSNFWIIALMKK